MDTGREPGRTFAPEDLGFLDFETRNPKTDIKAGTYRYMDGADAIICTFSLGGGPVRHVAVQDWVVPLRWSDMPADFHAFHDRVVAGEARWCAWNASFDRLAWNYGTVDFPIMEVEHIIDAMTQATTRGLPPGLKQAARFSGSTAKVESGGKLIKLFCIPGATAGPWSHPEQWREFIRYAEGDIVAMRDVFDRTLQLPLAEWREHWAMERINERGVRVDMPFVTQAARLAAEDKVRASADIRELTGGQVGSVDEVAKMTVWLLGQLPAEGREILLKREEEVDEDTGKITRPAKFHLTRKQVERLLAYLATAGFDASKPLRVLQIRLYGGSKTPAKFARIAQQQICDGVLCGQYVPSGASQTGRASSKGVQIHNLSRDHLAYEYDAIIAITAGCTYDRLARLGDDSPVARKLALLIRPAFVPAGNNLFVWSDWSNIEARVTPWLCDHHPGAAARVQLFRDVDADPTIPDLYTRTAASISGVPLRDVTRKIRQRGKVVELALGFLGGVGALHAMAASYGMHFTEDEAAYVVRRWRNENPWAPAFGTELWDAMLMAMQAPGLFFPVGRRGLGFIFVSAMLGGSMLMRLPSGRFLTYRALRWEDVDEKDADDNVVGKKRELTYGRGHARWSLWKGTLVENATQATAADVLRGTLVRLEAAGYAVRLHSHDEILLEVSDDGHEIAAAEAMLAHFMQQGFDWSEGLPLMSEETIAPYYTKAGG